MDELHDEEDKPRVLRLNPSFPPKLIPPLFESDNRYVVLHGGRGGGKSWAIARALLLRAVQKRTRVLCCREFMANIEQSVHRLLAEQVVELGLEAFFVVEKARVYNPQNMSEFVFAGIRNNPAGLKSYEGCDVAWVEEAANVSKHSWEILIPTIRKPLSQLIISFNPELSSDETYQRFVVNPPPNSIVVKCDYIDNPFFPEVLEEERALMEERDPDSYANIWGGNPRVYLENAVYGPELRTAQEEGRLTKVAYDDLVGCNVFWDIGWRDLTSCIIAQKCGMEFHVIDMIQGSHQTTAQYLKRLQDKPYIYDTHYLPHDAVAKEKGSGRSIEDIVRAAGNRVQIVTRLSVQDGIHAARSMFPRVWIDEVKCADLIQALRHYLWDMKRMPDGSYLPSQRPTPVHSIHSHAADAFRYMAISLRDARSEFKPATEYTRMSADGWMA
jgi:phage terminase large subunit